jgi:hypothetical protein
MNVTERLAKKLSDPANIRRIFDRLDHEAAFLPYWPEMLDFSLPENWHAEQIELQDYRGSYARAALAARGAREGRDG